MTPDPRTFILLLLATLAGCQASHSSPWDSGAGGQGADASAPEAGGAAGADAASDSTSVDGASAEAGPACVEAPTPLRTTGVVLSLPVVAVLGATPVTFGEPNELPGGGTIMPLNFRFYISHVALTSAAGAAVPVDLVDAAGAVEPFGVHLFVDEDPASHTLRVLAPPGTYTGVELTLGLDDACNSSPPASSRFPLGQTSMMVWPMGFGYLFLRFEGQSAAGAADAGAPPNVIHMGGYPHLVFAPTVKITGALTLAAGAPASRTVNLDLGAVFQGASTPLDPNGTPGLPIGPPDDPGERLRQHAPGLPLFVFAP